MARISTSVNTVVDSDAGAFELDSNLATMAGYGTMGAGCALAVGVGAAVAPAPVLGLCTLGAGLATVGHWSDLQHYFSKEGTAERQSRSVFDNWTGPSKEDTTKQETPAPGTVVAV